VPPGLRVKYKKPAAEASQDNSGGGAGAAADADGRAAGACNSSGAASPGVYVFEEPYALRKPGGEAKTRYSFSGVAQRDHSLSVGGGPAYASRGMAGGRGSGELT
jgi:hypothetical protein